MSADGFFVTDTTHNPCPKIDPVPIGNELQDDTLLSQNRILVESPCICIFWIPEALASLSCLICKLSVCLLGLAICERESLKEVDLLLVDTQTWIFSL